MAAPADNALQNVATYQKSELAFLLNKNVGISKANKKFKDFNTKIGNLGDTITWDLAPRAIASPGLPISSFTKSEQRVMTMTCTQSATVNTAYDSQQFIFNAEEYMERFGKGRVDELGAYIERDVLKNFVAGVTVNDPNRPDFGQNINPQSGAYRFFGNGIDPINSYGQLARALADFRDYGASITDVCGFLPMTVVPSIIDSGLNQFALNRNNEEAMSWELGDFSGSTWYQSNLLPIHIAGTIGEQDEVMTVVSTNDPLGENITQITFNTAILSDANAIKSGDLIQIQDGVVGQPNLRYLTWIGHSPSSQPVQIRATSDASSDGSGNVIVDFYPALQATLGLNQNLTSNLVAGMQSKAVPSHRAGQIYSGDPLYLAMPKLDDQDPYNTVTTMDSETGASMRSYWGARFAENFKGYVTDCIWNSVLVAENSMRVVIPLSQ